jgi:hypothetical protein
MRVLALALAAAAGLAAQSYYPRHNVSFAVGGAQPKGELFGAFSTKPGISVGYGYRFQRYFQADIGFDTVFGAANVRAFQESPFGYLRIRDHQYFLPMGGRAIIPLIGGRLLISGGGGGAYMRYSESLRQPSDYYRIDCPTCSVRSGWGYYALADISAFVDSAQHIRLGVVSKVYRGHTDGDPLAGVPGVRTRDRWVNIMGQVGFSF